MCGMIRGPGVQGGEGGTGSRGSRSCSFLIPGEFVCLQNLIDTGQLKPRRFHLEQVRGGDVRGLEQDEQVWWGGSGEEQGEGGGEECGVKTQE